MILVMPQNFRDYWEGGTFSYIPSVQHPLWEFLPRSLEHSPWQAWYYHCSTSANAKVGFNRNPLMCLIMAPGQPPPPLLLLSPIINCRSLVLIQTFSTVFGSASALPTLYFYFIFLFFMATASCVLVFLIYHSLILSHLLKLTLVPSQASTHKPVFRGVLSLNRILIP